MQSRLFSPHPAVSLTFFILVIGGSMCLTHPALLAASLVSAAACALTLGGGRAAKFLLRGALPLMLLVAALNPLFVHRGFWILGYLPDGNPLTMEAVAYGLASGGMLAAVLGWFFCLNEVMDSDQMLWLFGRAAPALSLLVSMTLRLIPRMKRQLYRIADAQQALGMGAAAGGPLRRARHGMRMLSILITWALENAVETADSMKARGYGLRDRRSFSIFRFTRRDGCLLAAMLAPAAAVAAGAAGGAFRFQYYPYFKWGRVTPLTCTAGAAYLLLGLLPCLLTLGEELKWRSLTSGT